MRFKAKILVVEDDTAMLRLLGTVLAELGAEPHLLANSVHAAKLVEREKFDGIFLDWKMPDMDGLELARRVRQSRSNSKVTMVMLTGVTNRRAVEESFKVGINFFLQKPVSTSQLRHLLNASRGQMLEERRRYQRAPIALPMRCQWDEQECLGQVINLSASGVLLDLPDVPPLGTLVHVEFDLPDDPKPVRLAGIVTRRAAGRGVGIRFLYQNESLRARLKDVVDQVIARLDHRGEGRPMPV